MERQLTPPYDLGHAALHNRLYPRGVFMWSVGWLTNNLTTLCSLGRMLADIKLLPVQLRAAVQDGLGPFSPPTRLGERSTFQWDQLTPGSPRGVHRRIASFRDAAARSSVAAYLEQL